MTVSTLNFKAGYMNVIPNTQREKSILFRVVGTCLCAGFFVAQTEAKNKNLFIRVSEKEKNIIEHNAKKCGLSVSEYLRQRALGYMPRAVLP